MDTGNAKADISLFVEGAERTDVMGKQWDAAANGVRGFTQHFLKSPLTYGGQHYHQIIQLAKVSEGRYVARSLLSLFKWDKSEAPVPSLHMLGHYKHWVVQSDGRSRFANMVIKRWLTGDSA